MAMIQESDASVQERAVSALSNAEFPDEVVGRYYRLPAADPTRLTIALVLSSDHWDATTEDLCDKARDVARAAIRSIDIAVSFTCRLAEEHASYGDREAGLWTAIEANRA